MPTEQEEDRRFRRVMIDTIIGCSICIGYLGGVIATTIGVAGYGLPVLLLLVVLPLLLRRYG